MGSLAAQDAADGDERIVFPGARQLFRCQWQLESSRNMKDGNIFVAGSCSAQRIDRGVHKPLGDKAVEPAHNYAQAKATGGESAADFILLGTLRHSVVYFPLNCAARFSR